jgi:hypothetical protein
VEPCPQCGGEVWGFIQKPCRTGQTQPAGPPTSYVMLFPCEHLVWLPIYSGAKIPDSEPVGVGAELRVRSV